MTEAMPFLQKFDITFLRPPTIGRGIFILLHEIFGSIVKKACGPLWTFFALGGPGSTFATHIPRQNDLNSSPLRARIL